MSQGLYILVHRPNIYSESKKLTVGTLQFMEWVM